MSDASGLGSDFLDDLERIQKDYGLGNTFSFDTDYFYLELEAILVVEARNQLLYSLVSVSLVIYFMTVSASMTLLIVLNVLLVNVFMLGYISLWGFEFNFLVSTQLSFAIGVAVDYSSHIALAFMMAEPPARYPAWRKRAYKARKALSQMGVSVFHGGFSTLTAIFVLSKCKYYIFVGLFKCWLCIISFGLLNGLILLPVTLSLIGPINQLTN